MKRVLLTLIICVISCNLYATVQTVNVADFSLQQALGNLNMAGYSITSALNITATGTGTFPVIAGNRYDNTATFTSSGTFLKQLQVGDQINANTGLFTSTVSASQIIVSTITGNGTDSAIKLDPKGDNVAVTTITASLMDIGTNVNINGAITSNGAAVPTLNTVIYSTDTIAITFASSDTATGCVVYQSTITYRLPTDITVIGSHILSNDVSGSITIAISTGDTVAGTWIKVSTGAAMITNTEYHNDNLNQWTGNKNLPKGKLLKFYLAGAAPVTTQSVTYQLDYIKKLW